MVSRVRAYHRSSAPYDYFYQAWRCPDPDVQSVRKREVTVESISQRRLRLSGSSQGSFILPATGNLLAGEYVQRPEEAPALAGERAGSRRADEAGVCISILNCKLLVISAADIRC
ncbi:hypothetical protein VPH35_055666 [Triticum aestivum]